jgi:hypothetical protein
MKSTFRRWDAGPLLIFTRNVGTEKQVYLIGRRRGADAPARPRILSPFEGILPDLTKRDEPVFTGLAAVKVMLRLVTSHDRMSSS